MSKYELGATGGGWAAVMQGSGTGRCYGLCTPPKWAGALVHEMRSMRHMCDTVLLEFHACSISVIVMLQYSTNEALGHSPSFLTFTVTCWQLNSLCKMLPESGNRWEIITNNKKLHKCSFVCNSLSVHVSVCFWARSSCSLRRKEVQRIQRRQRLKAWTGCLFFYFLLSSPSSLPGHYKER